MIKKATDNSFEAFNSGVNHEPQIENLDRGTVPPYLLDSERVSVYLTLAGLLDAGVDIDTALTLFETESKAQKQKHNADRVSEFFKAARAAREDVKSRADGHRTDTIGEVAEKCFGKNFTSSEELVLLRGLAYTDNIPAILRAAADIIRSRNSSLAAVRPALPGRRFKS
ncbi:hypothetical protein OIU34_22520 [Pararhizobium sp. BT-229]|uniref:hypothetical protein n=1 Tax=Pararhizobium sp. BT-229 TaxID=2986923 RepID=UPI0021F75408|nr:hypothetical protein [Pararhizobium sp. BT-229]MCV9964669.1 hypothetical protein [Pararhizobium sp. BT-229]